MPFSSPEGLDFEETKRWLELMVNQELTGLQRAKGFQVTLGPYQAWLLLQCLQEAYHRLEGDSRDLARDIGRTITEGYLAEGTVLRRFADLGWDHPPVRLSARDLPGIPEAYLRAFAPDPSEPKE